MSYIGRSLVSFSWRHMHSRKIGHLCYFLVGVLAASATASIAITVAWLILKYFDEPVRAQLTRRYGIKRATA